MKTYITARDEYTLSIEKTRVLDHWRIALTRTVQGQGEHTVELYLEDEELDVLIRSLE